MSTAKNKFYNQDRGFGFLRTDDGDQLFFHISAWQGDQEDIEEGAAVQFEASNARDGRPSTCGRLTGPLRRCSGIGEAGELKAISRVVCTKGRLHAPCLTSIYPT